MAEKSEKGIRCRNCGCGHFYVVKTRQAAGGRVMRVRECRHCGRHVVTYEAAAGDPLPVSLEDLSPKQRQSLLDRLLHVFGL